MSKQDVIDTLTKLKGIGTAKAQALYDAGFSSIESIQKASIDDLMSVEGISETIATSIQDQLGKKKPSKPAAKKSTGSGQPSKTEKPEKISSPPKKTTPDEEPPSPPKKKQEKDEIVTEEEIIEEIPEYEVKKKPALPKDLQEKIRIRTQIKKRTPTFLREEWFRYKRLAKNWRRPDGLHSKMRMNMKYRPNKVRVGFRGPRQARGLHPSGFEEVIVYTVKDLESIDADTQAARIGGTVGSKKRQAIIEKAKERDIRLLNK